MVRFTGIRAVIVDLDGTMLDTAPDFQCAINRMRAELSLAPLDLEQIKRFVGKGSENLIRRVLAVDYDDAGVDTHFALAMAAYQRHYLAINGDFATLYPHVHEGLAQLRTRGIALACVTNKPIAFTGPLLKKHALDSYFSVVYGGDSLPNKKPDPLPFQQVFADFGIAPQQAVAIGDSSNDAVAARAAGCHVLTVPYGYNHGEPVQKIDSDGIVATLLDAAQLISV
ncbi:MAG: phosphoglycolate phosphatase [Pseudomonadota bacterium]|nr:phosphoglycolate phosphatase [Pseudomonadota bacterium]